MKSWAYPDGSITKGYLLNLFKIIAFWLQISSLGSLCDYQNTLSEAVDKNSEIDRSALNFKPTSSIYFYQVVINKCLYSWSKNPQ